MIVEARIGDRLSRVDVRAVGDRYLVKVDDRSLDADVRDCGYGALSFLVDGQSHDVAVEGQGGVYAVTIRGFRTIVEIGPVAPAGVAPRHGSGSPARLAAPMPGKIVRILVSAGAWAEAGQGLVVMEAMKMENELRAPRSGTVREVHVREGQTVETGALLAIVE
ncbi:MAG: biotin/lipoyl-containing protein [Vicinamibacteria bacterium]